MKNSYVPQDQEKVQKQEWLFVLKLAQGFL